MLKMVEVFGSTSAADISAFEQRHGIRLPEPYKQFLLKNNGGDADGGFFEVPGWGRTLVAYFNGIGLSGSYDLDGILDRIGYFFPKNLLPIADDPGGNQICISLADKTFGQIYSGRMTKVSRLTLTRQTSIHRCIT